MRAPLFPSSVIRIVIPSYRPGAPPPPRSRDPSLQSQNAGAGIEHAPYSCDSSVRSRTFQGEGKLPRVMLFKRTEFKIANLCSRANASYYR